MKITDKSTGNFTSFIDYCDYYTSLGLCVAQVGKNAFHTARPHIDHVLQVE